MLHHRRMIFEGLLAIIIFALVPLAIKFTAATPLTICLFRLFVAVSALSFLWRKKIAFKAFFGKDKDSWKLWLIGGIFFLHWISYAYGVKWGGPSIAVLGMSTYGIQLVFASALFFNQHITKKDIFCFCLSLLGLLMIVPSWSFKDESTKGLIIALLSATFFALLPVMHRLSEKFNQETRIFSQFSGAMAFFLLFAGKTHWQLRANDWWALLFLGIFGTLVAHSLWARVSTKVSAAHAGLTYYTIGPLTILMSFFILGERATSLQLTGAFIVISAAVINFIGSRR